MFVFFPFRWILFGGGLISVDKSMGGESITADASHWQPIAGMFRIVSIPVGWGRFPRPSSSSSPSFGSGLDYHILLYNSVVTTVVAVVAVSVSVC